MPTQKRKENKVNEDQDVLGHVHKQAPRHAAICKTLLKEIATVLPKANPRIYYARPAASTGTERPILGIAKSRRLETSSTFPSSLEKRLVTQAARPVLDRAGTSLLNGTF
jgi:hypothetical protein